MESSLLKKIAWLTIEFAICFGLAIYFDLGNQGFGSIGAMLFALSPWLLAWIYFIFWDSAWDIVVKFTVLSLGYLIGVSYKIYGLFGSLERIITEFSLNDDVIFWLVIFLFIIMFNWFLGREIARKLIGDNK
jgi:hypothetical protein